MPRSRRLNYIHLSLAGIEEGIILTAVPVPVPMNNVLFLYYIYIREGLIRKIKKSVKFHTLGPDPPPKKCET